MLSFLLCEASKRGILAGVSIAREAPIISHLFFADDSLLFGAVDAQECDGLAMIIKQDSDASGQRISFDKSSIFFSSNTKQEDKEVILPKTWEFWRSLIWEIIWACLLVWGKTKRWCLTH